ncbi:MAG: hypothetical protein JST00_07660 [Deltaproteobacteria bacterium]|nr:hypothetical protein [Deltaproteobacteria bacterium]
MRSLRAFAWLFVPIALIGLACSSFDDEDTPASDGGTDADASLSEGGSDAAVEGDAEAGPIDAGADARTYRYVFVTKGTRGANFATSGDSGVPEADKFCHNEVLGVPTLQDLEWRAFLGHFPDLDPRDRIADAGVLPYEYRLINGAIVFRKGLKYGPTAPLVPETLVTLDQYGADASDLQVWTGAEPTGKAHPSESHCGRWLSTNGSGITGWTSYSPLPGDKLQWLQASLGATLSPVCTSMHHIYCFEVDP